MRRPDVPIVGDCRLVIEELVVEIRNLLASGTTQADTSAWKSRISGWQESYPLTYEQSDPGDALEAAVLPRGAAGLGAADDTILVSGVGQHQMWASQYWHFEEPYTWVNSGGLGTMGFSVPAAIGAKVGRPDRTVWAVDGDGCFQMTAQELVTASTERIPIKVAILNNSYLGMVRQWQEMFYEERYSEVYLSPDLPDYVKWAEAMGCIGIRVESPEEVQPAIDKANEIDDRPVVRRVPRRRPREGVPDGAGRPVQRRHRAAPEPGRGSAAMTSATHDGGGPNHHILSVLVENKAGVLARVASLFARRGFNIFSLAVAPTEDERFSRITIVVDVESAPLEQITKQLFKLINVVKISELDPRDVGRARAAAGHGARPTPDDRGQVVELVQIFEGKILAVGAEAITVSLDGHPDKLDDFEELLRGYGIVELQRTGRVALPKLDP